MWGDIFLSCFWTHYALALENEKKRPSGQTQPHVGDGSLRCICGSNAQIISGGVFTPHTQHNPDHPHTQTAGNNHIKTRGQERLKFASPGETEDGARREVSVSEARSPGALPLALRALSRSRSALPAPPPAAGPREPPSPWQWVLFVVSS